MEFLWDNTCQLIQGWASGITSISAINHIGHNHIGHIEDRPQAKSISATGRYRPHDIGHKRLVKILPLL